MMGNHFSLILLPTLKCNAECDYCFENKTSDSLSLEELTIVIHKVLGHMEQNAIQSLTIHWQGGEVMTLPPQWFERAHELIQKAAQARGKTIHNCIQSNLIGYSRKWNQVLREMFGNSVGSSLDFPNLHRKIRGCNAPDYNTLWARKVQEAREAGIEVQVISIPNSKTLEIGAERFYEYFVEELQVTDFQINTPFPGGTPNETKNALSLETERLSQFFIELADVWVSRGYSDGVRIGPFDVLLDYFSNGTACLPCIWQKNCATEFVCIDARGNVSQCDCWVTSYPEYWFGNIFECHSFSDLLRTNAARRRFQARPGRLVQQETCIDCDYLALCHGGCPIRAYTVSGNLMTKDPYCQLYQALFRHTEALATHFAGLRSIQ
jgi:radical SAM protein with 4Fe4S-binding SPASM domain